METLRQARIRRIAKIKAKKSVLFKQNNKNNDKLIDEHTLMFVAIHEMSHTCTKSVGHKSEFWENFKFLENAKESKIHIPVDYTKSPVEYCDMTIKDNPYYAA
jgi:predicted metal-dependent hydrolase